MNLRLPFRVLLVDKTDLAGEHVNFDNLAATGNSK